MTGILDPSLSISFADDMYASLSLSLFLYTPSLSLGDVPRRKETKNFLLNKAFLVSESIQQAGLLCVSVCVVDVFPHPQTAFSGVALSRFITHEGFRP